MKKNFLFLAIVAILSSFTISTSIIYSTKLGYTCEAMPIAIDSVQGKFSGEMFNYRIKYCSQQFTAKQRYIKFKLMFVDKAGNIITETATGPVLNKESRLTNDHIAGIPLTVEPYDCIISWWYRDTPETEWQFVETRSLQLFKNKK